MASKQQASKAKARRGDEIERAGIFALNGLKDTGSFASFCQQLKLHAQQGAEFAQLISSPHHPTQDVQQAYTALANKAERLQQENLAPDTSFYLRAMLVNDLLIAQDMEKYLHAQAMPIDFTQRALRVGAWTGGLALSGLGLAFLGDAAGGHLTQALANHIIHDAHAREITAGAFSALLNKTVSPDLLTAADTQGMTDILTTTLDLARLMHAGNINLIIDHTQAVTSLDSTTAGLAKFTKSLLDAHILDVQPSGIGLDQTTFALTGGALGALTTAPQTLLQNHRDHALAQRYMENTPASVIADTSLRGKALSEAFQQATRLYNDDLTATVRQEATLTPHPQR